MLGIVSGDRLARLLEIILGKELWRRSRLRLVWVSASGHEARTSSWVDDMLDVSIGYLVKLAETEN